MQSHNKAVLLSLWSDKMLPENLLIISKQLDSVQDDKLETLILFKLKSPVLTLIFSLFLGCFGVDRFYLGDVILGILKIIFGAFTFGIWYFLDFFLTYKKSKQINFNKTINMINLVS